ncbi:related to thioesterase family protein [Phialocephala subalpina]|uniref:Related to thioesterase family protein n=1 Tax=Phialocephala subalpina TaxID=576137 RepID=A0A1L7WFS2_9HELO|nr:related to thioesterase family protein [Phialocephala subalpina]
MITRLPARRLTIHSASRLVSRPATRCTHHIKSRPTPSRQLDGRYLHGRLYSTSPPPPASETSKPIDLRSQFSDAHPTPPPSAEPAPQRSLRPYIYATLFFMIGLTVGQYVRLVLAPPPLPPAGTKEDELMVQYLQKQAEHLPIVQSLSNDPKWTHHDAYTSLPEHERSHRLTTGPLAGARAIGGYQRIFFNQESGETITVIWFGGAIAGWPGVTHGGVIATIFDESLGRCAIRQFPAKTGVTANLELNYLKPVVTNSFYVIRAVPDQGATDTKCWVSARLETLEGRVCVEAKALFVVPKKFQTRKSGGQF